MKKMCAAFVWIICMYCQMGGTQMTGLRLALENSIMKGMTKLQPKMKPEIQYEPPNFEAYYYNLYGDEPSAAVGIERRNGTTTLSSSCGLIREVPAELRHYYAMRPIGIPDYYEKYTEAYNIPVLAAVDVPDEALERACYVLRFLLADRSDFREQFYQHYGRIVVLGQHELLHQLPDYKFLGMYMNATRGVGAIPMAPLSTIGEENLLCYRGSTFSNEDLAMREIAMGLLYLAARYVKPGYYLRIKEAYDNAILRGRWHNTYASISPAAYFGEGVQSFFGVNGYEYPAGGMHNYVNSRTQLLTYDTDLYWLIHEMFPCGNFYIKRCKRRGNERFQKLTMNCLGHTVEDIWGY